MGLTRVLSRSIADYSNPNSLGSRFRAARAAPLVSMINDVHKIRGEVRIVDIGGTPGYWKILPENFIESRHVHITMINLPGYAQPVPDEMQAYFSSQEGDGCDLKFANDKVFDIAHSNSVIEHVGDWDRMVRFAHEIRRVAPRYFVQTPNYWFPVEPHFMTPFFHWLPEPMRIAMVRKFNLGGWRRQESLDSAIRVVQDARLLTKPMMQALFPDALIRTERLLFLPKSLIAVKDTDGK